MHKKPLNHHYVKKINKLEDKVCTVRPGFRKTIQELHLLQNYVEIRQWLKEQSKKLAFLHREERQEKQSRQDCSGLPRFTCPD